MAGKLTRQYLAPLTSGVRSTTLKRTKASGVPGLAPAPGIYYSARWLLVHKSLARWWRLPWGIPVEEIGVSVEGDLDLQGTLGISKTVPVGFDSIRIKFDVRAPQATPEQMTALQQKTEQYCVVMQTLLHPPQIQNQWSGVQ
jgi:hypothetical protein